MQKWNEIPPLPTATLGPVPPPPRAKIVRVEIRGFRGAKLPVVVFNVDPNGFLPGLYPAWPAIRTAATVALVGGWGADSVWVVFEDGAVPQEVRIDLQDWAAKGARNGNFGGEV